MPNHEKLFDKKEVRAKAKGPLNLDAVVIDNYPLDIENARQFLSEALATEILCVLRYRQHQVIAVGLNSPQVAAEFEEHAMDEEKHMMMIAERLHQIGGEPDLNPTKVAQEAVTEFNDEKDLVGLIESNLVAERIVIDVYRRLVQWFGNADPTTRRMLEVILEQEEEHASDLANLLNTHSKPIEKH